MIYEIINNATNNNGCIILKRKTTHYGKLVNQLGLVVKPLKSGVINTKTKDSIIVAIFLSCILLNSNNMFFLRCAMKALFPLLSFFLA